MPRASHLSLVVAALIAIVPAPARADATGAARADALFRDAKQLIDQGRLREACEKFAESQRLDPALGTLLNLADCHAQSGQVAAARAEFVVAAELAVQRGEKAREAFARAEVAKLEKQLARLTLSIAPSAVV